MKPCTCTAVRLSLVPSPRLVTVCTCVVAKVVHFPAPRRELEPVPDVIALALEAARAEIRRSENLRAEAERIRREYRAMGLSTPPAPLAEVA